MPELTPTYFDYRGVKGLVAAEVICDDNQVGAGHGYVTGEVKAIAGTAEIGRTTDSSTAVKYYDDIPAITIASNSADTVTINASGIPLNIAGWLTGQQYDDATGALIEGKRTIRYFAIGYIAEKTDGTAVYVGRYKGTFAIPDQTNATIDDGTDSNGQTLVYTGIQTQHAFDKCTDANGNKTGAKALCVDTGLGLAVVDNFFDTVTTPDTLIAKAHELTIVPVEDVTITVTKGGTSLVTGATIYYGDVLTITATGTGDPMVIINGVKEDSGSVTYTVTGDVTVTAGEIESTP